MIQSELVGLKPKLNVIPSLACDYSINGIVVHAKLSSKRMSSINTRISFVSETNLKDLILSKLLCVFSLKSGITAIFSLSSNPKMRWTNAGSVISTGAVVENTQSIWYSSVVKNPRCNVGRDCASKVTATGNLPISSRCFTSSPNPAGIGFVYFLPKSIFKRAGKTSISKVWILIQRNFVSSTCKCLAQRLIACNLFHVSSFAPLGLLDLRGTSILRKGTINAT